MASKRRSANNIEGLTAQSTISGSNEYLTSTNGVLNTSSGGSGGAVTLADGADTAEGTTTDAKVLGDNPGTVSAKLRGINTALATGVPVTGTFFQATQPVSISGTLPVNMTQINGVASSVGNGTTDTGTQRVTLSSDSTGQVKLATGANTIGAISNTAFTANIGTTNGLALDATLTGGNAQVQGNVASGSADAGNPVKVGGKYNATMPTFTDGNRGDIQLTTRGAIKTTLFGNDANVPITALADNADASGASSTANKLAVQSRNTIFNGTTWDRLYSVINATNSVGTGIIASGLLAQVDDTSPTTITENQFGNVRMSADRSILVAARATTPTQTTVAGSASSVSILVSNINRKGATVTNDSSAVLYLKLGSTASTTSYTVVLAGAASAPFSYYEVPFGYIGAIDGIWASATGNARITEMT